MCTDVPQEIQNYIFSRNRTITQLNIMENDIQEAKKQLVKIELMKLKPKMIKVI